MCSLMRREVIGSGENLTAYGTTIWLYVKGNEERLDFREMKFLQIARIKSARAKRGNETSYTLYESQLTLIPV